LKPIEKVVQPHSCCRSLLHDRRNEYGRLVKRRPDLSVVPPETAEAADVLQRVQEGEFFAVRRGRSPARDIVLRVVRDHARSVGLGSSTSPAAKEEGGSYRGSRGGRP
jgi:hypothetical protein